MACEMKLLLLICSLNGLTSGVNPGLKARISQSGLDYAATVAVDIVAGNLQQASFPDQSGSADIKVGKVDYEFKNMKITNFQKPSTSVTVNAGSGLTWSLNGASISVHGDWHYEYRLGFIKIRDSGSFDVSATGTSGSISVSLGAGSSGEPTIHSTGCSCHVNDLSISLHGGASWLYDLFVQFIENPLRDNVQTKICEAARNAVDVDASRELATLKVQVVIDDQWLLDYRLTSPPSFSTSYLESYHKGEFFFVGQQTEAPFQPAELPSPQTSDRMVNFWVSDYVLNTAGYVLHQHGVLSYDLTRKDLPDEEKVFLNTTCCPTCQCLGKFLPAVAKSYPDASVEAHMSTVEPPTIAINSSAVCSDFTGTIRLSARLTNESLAYLFTVNVHAVISVIPSFDGLTLKAHVGQFDETISITDSQIGPVSASVLTFFFNYAKKVFIVPQLNKVGDRGFPLPHIDHVRFTNTGFQLMLSCIHLQTDVQYNTQTLYFEP